MEKVNRTCVNCGKREYEYGNMGLCYFCVREENSQEKLEKELKSEIGQISIGRGEIGFILGQLEYVKRNHESSRYYNARSDFVRNTLREQCNLVWPKPIKNRDKTLVHKSLSNVK